VTEQRPEKAPRPSPRTSAPILPPLWWSSFWPSAYAYVSVGVHDDFQTFREYSATRHYFTAAGVTVAPPARAGDSGVAASLDSGASLADNSA
jgi:hypothetical protein